MDFTAYYQRSDIYVFIGEPKSCSHFITNGAKLRLSYKYIHIPSLLITPTTSDLVKYFCLLFFQAPIEVGPSEHKLQYTYGLWYIGKTNYQQYDFSLKKIGRFASVEQFWALYSHLVRPSDLNSPSDFFVFKDGLKPMWEHKVRSNRGQTEENDNFSSKFLEILQFFYILRSRKVNMKKMTIFPTSFQKFCSFFYILRSRKVKQSSRRVKLSRKMF